MELFSTNAERVALAEKVLGTSNAIRGEAWSPDDPCTLLDLLADLMHCARSHGWDFSDLVNTAAGHFEAELAEAEYNEEAHNEDRTDSIHLLCQEFRQPAQRLHPLQDILRCLHSEEL